jgi:hypothetical protein
MVRPFADNLLGAEQRFGRFAKLFRAQNAMAGLLNEILDAHKNEFRVRSGPDRRVSLLIALNLQKGLKTFQAIVRLCLLGYGEDALILLRSNINLLVNLTFVISSQDSVERTNQLLAYSYKQRLEYLRESFDFREPVEPPVPQDQVESYAKAWPSVKVRAENVGGEVQWHYQQGYRLYSSIEHSDAAALKAYVDSWNETGPVLAGESDRWIDLALIHNVGVLRQVLLWSCKYFGIDRPDVLSRALALWVDLGRENKSTTNGAIEP